jgi:enamine deaminase RidA (YjgF/YER057c/UK114 family)
MNIQRLGTTRRWSDAVIHNGTVYCVDVAHDPQADLESQTRAVLSQIEQTLINAGSDKSRLLSVTIYLSDIRHIDAFNAIWDAWVPEGCAPSRACVQATMANPGYKVELAVVAAMA